MATRGDRNLDSRDVTVFHVVDGKVAGGLDQGGAT